MLAPPLFSPFTSKYEFGNKVYQIQEKSVTAEDVAASYGAVASNPGFYLKRTHFPA
jgi:hypothetical protein